MVSISHAVLVEPREVNLGLGEALLQQTTTKPGPTGKLELTAACFYTYA